MISRRIFGKLALGSVLPVCSWAKIDSTVHGVRIGVSGYSFQHASLDQAIENIRFNTIVQCGHPVFCIDVSDFIG